MADFTKGEWRVITNGNTLMAIVVTNRNICSFQPLFESPFNRQVGGEDEANANLIAAAPDMYDALEAIIAKRTESHETEAAYIPPEIELAYKAKAKAEGKSNS